MARQAGPSLRDKVVLDLSNPIKVRDGQVELVAVPDGRTAAEHQQATLGPVRLVKAFNLVCAAQLDAVTRPRPGRQARGGHLVADANFAPVDACTLADAAATEPTLRCLRQVGGAESISWLMPPLGPSNTIEW